MLQFNTPEDCEVEWNAEKEMDVELDTDDHAFLELHGVTFEQFNVGDVSFGPDGIRKDAFKSEGGVLATGGSASGGGFRMSETAKKAVVEALLSLTEDGKLKETTSKLVQLNRLIGKGTEDGGFIPKACLLLLDEEQEVAKALKSHTPIPSGFLTNLTTCIVAAWPSCTIEKQDVRGGSVRGHKFNGFYIDGLEELA